MAAPPTIVSDVVVIGRGLAGKAACLHLAKVGLSVICIEPADKIRPAVGESLDWSAPELLKSLGLPMEHLVEKKIATWKRHVTLQMRDGCAAHYVPTPWLAGPPFHIELRTLHVDRFRLDEELSRLVGQHGVTLIRDKVTRVERRGDKIDSVDIADGRSISASWFIDASGLGLSLLAREFGLPALQFGPPKVALWTYFKAPQTVEGTTLYMDPQPSEYLDWVWEIPINPETVSVGFITPGPTMKSLREQGLSNDEVFQRQLRKFPHFESLLNEGALNELNVTSFRCRAHLGVAGPNWLIVGEAASMVDPITANGVTAALRHAAEAAALILKFRKRGNLPLRARFAYNSRILQLAKFFNGGIEKIVYDPPVRNRIGLQSSGTAYTSPAWSMNVVYARMKPRGIFSTFIYNSILRLFRCAAWIVYQFCRLFPRRVEVPQTP
jgi:flavin-dependent dehydrogenase